jgi:hypothetical protein
MAVTIYEAVFSSCFTDVLLSTVTWIPSQHREDLSKQGDDFRSKRAAGGKHWPAVEPSTTPLGNTPFTAQSTRLGVMRLHKPYLLHLPPLQVSTVQPATSLDQVWPFVEPSLGAATCCSWCNRRKGGR